MFSYYGLPSISSYETFGTTTHHHHDIILTLDFESQLRHRGPTTALVMRQCHVRSDSPRAYLSADPYSSTPDISSLSSHFGTQRNSSTGHRPMYIFSFLFYQAAPVFLRLFRHPFSAFSDPELLFSSVVSTTMESVSQFRKLRVLPTCRRRRTRARYGLIVATLSPAYTLSAVIDIHLRVHREIYASDSSTPNALSSVLCNLILA